MKATWKNTVLAESDKTVVIEGNHYFPPTRSKKNISSRTKSTALARGKVSRATIMSGLAIAPMRTRRGITLSQRKPPSRSRITSLSGEV